MDRAAASITASSQAIWAHTIASESQTGPEDDVASEGDAELHLEDASTILRLEEQSGDPPIVAARRINRQCVDHAGEASVKGWQAMVHGVEAQRRIDLINDTTQCQRNGVDPLVEAGL